MHGNLFSNAPFDVVCAFDPAIDRECDAKQYVELRDLSLLKFAAGQVPTVYTIRRLPNSIVIAILARSDSEETRNALAFRAGVVAVRNLNAISGSYYEMWKPRWCASVDQGTGESMSDEELDMFPIDEMQDIGSVALARANLRKGRPVCFVPPQSSADAWGRMVRSYHRAEQSDLPSKKLDAPKEPAVRPSSSPGEQDGAVTAAAV